MRLSWGAPSCLGVRVGSTSGTPSCGTSHRPARPRHGRGERCGPHGGREVASHRAPGSGTFPGGVQGPGRAAPKRGGGRNPLGAHSSQPTLLRSSSCLTSPCRPLRSPQPALGQGQPRRPLLEPGFQSLPRAVLPRFVFPRAPPSGEPRVQRERGACGFVRGNAADPQSRRCGGRAPSPAPAGHGADRHCRPSPG